MAKRKRVIGSAERVFLSDFTLTSQQLQLSLHLVFKFLGCSMDFLDKIKQNEKKLWRVVKLLISLWMVADVVLDGLTTKGYLDYALVSKMTF